MRAAIALGSNLGSRWAYLRAAVDALDATQGTRVVARSGVYETKPVDAPGPDYLNAVVLVETTLSPRALFERSKAIEAALGRTPAARRAPRVVDLDLILIDGEPIREPGLVVPHAAASSRAFVLAPLSDVWPEARLGEDDVETLLARVGGTPGPRHVFTPEANVAVLDHTADVALRVVAPDEADLLAAASAGLVDVILNRTGILGVDRIDLEVEGADPEERLVALLTEIVARFEIDAVAPRRVLVPEVFGETVRAALWGEPFDARRHEAHTAVKAVTYHDLRVERAEEGLACTVTLDL